MPSNSYANAVPGCFHAGEGAGAVVRNIVTLLTLRADLHIIPRHDASGGSSIQLANCAGGSTSTKSAWLRVTKICWPARTMAAIIKSA
jgi:hypothetical protein